jgi:uncharacterized repeat protein (TIGR01451 family)
MSFFYKLQNKCITYLIIFLLVFSSFHPLVVFAEPTTDGLIRHWRLDELASGGVGSVLDSSPTGDHGTPIGPLGTNNTPQPSLDVPEVSFENERSRNFDGVDDYIQTSYSPALSPGDAFTWSLWFKTNEDQSGIGVFSARDTSKAGNPLAEIYLVSGQVQGLFRGSNGARRDLVYNVNYSDNQWHNISIVIDDGEGILYFNGVERSSFSGLDMNINLSDVFLAIGAANYENNIQRYFEGFIDDVRVYNRALSPGEISELAGVFPISEDFNGPKPDKWELRSNASWGAAVDGEQVLRLTTAQTSQSGLGYYDTAFSSDKGIVAEFDYYSNEGTGADGIVFFLVDGDLVTVDNIAPGAFGSSLGYALSGTTPGVPHAYLGVGFDEFGGFPRSGGGKTGIEDPSPDNVTLRGAGNGTTGYNYLTHTQVSQAPINQNIDGGWRKVRVGVNPTETSSVIRVEMSWDEGDTWYTVIDDYEYNEAPPEFFKLGFTAGTGGSTNIHAVDNLKVSLPADIELSFVDEPVGTYDVGDLVEYAYTIVNNGPNNAGDVTIENTISLGDAGFIDVSYSYSSTGGVTGNGDETTISSFVVPIDVGDIVTVTVQGTLGEDVDLDAGLDHTVSTTPGFGIIDPSPGDGFISVAVATEDGTPPFILTLSPNSDTLDFSPEQNLFITFNEPVTKGFGSLVFYKASDDRFVFTVDVTSVYVSGEGTNTITINPPNNLLPLTDFYVHIPNTAFRDLSNNPFPGFEDSTTWTFTTTASPETQRVAHDPLEVTIQENGGVQELVFTLEEPIVIPEGQNNGLVLYVVSSDINLVTVNTFTLNWTNEEWNEPRTVVLTAVDNDDVGDGFAYIHWSIFTASEYYKDLSGSVPVNIIDDERPVRLGQSQSSSATARVATGCRDPRATNYVQFARHDASMCQYATQHTTQVSGDTVLPQETFIDTISFENKSMLVCKNLGTRNRLLRIQDRGEDVSRVQQCLNEHGASLVVDGIFGSRTDAALRAFQQIKNITVDGLVGNQTWRVMQGI